LALDVVFFLLS